MKLGRKPQKHDPRTVRFASALVGAPVPAAPPARRWSTHNGKPIAFKPFLNLDLGCCTASAIGHLDQVVSEHTGTAPEIDDAYIRRAYQYGGGWVPSDPSTDDGANMLDMLRWFRTQGLILAYAEIDVENLDHVEACLNLMGAVYVGWDLPTAWQKPGVWDVAPAGSTRPPEYDRNSWGGHAASIVDYDQTHFTVATWGRLQKVTRAAFKTYAAEGYAVIHHRWVTETQATPSGFVAKRILDALARIRD